MRTVSQRIVVDTYAWVEFFRGSRKGAEVRRLLLTSQAYTPSIVLAELSRKYAREGLEKQYIEQRLILVTKATKIVDMSVTLALETAQAYMHLLKHSHKFRLKQKPSLIDAIILATARSLGAKVLTGDQHFKGLSETLWLGDPNP